MKDREVRKTRGQRINQLIGELEEQDKIFWESEIWKEESEDESFDEEEEKALPDQFDSDFNDSEDDDSDESDEERTVKKSEPAKKRAANQYTEPKRVKIPRKTTDDGPKPKPAAVLGPSSVTLRGTTKLKTHFGEVARQAAANNAPQRARASPVPKVQFTQKALLQDALDTEQSNIKWLITQKLAEEQAVAMDKPVKAKPTSYIRYLSRKDCYPTITFSDDATWPAQLFDAPPPQPPNKLCVITNLPARYRDPVTGLPYRDAAALKELRKRA